MSTPPSASIASSTKAVAPSAVPTSATSGTDPGSRSAASWMRVLSRPQMATWTPSAWRAWAVAKPRPDDAAATAARRPDMPRSMVRYRTRPVALGLLVAEIMTTDVIAFHAGDRVEVAARALLEKGIGGAPVVDADNRVVGLLEDDDRIV